MKSALVLMAFVTVGCASNAPAPSPVVEYKTVVVDRSCTLFKKITGHPSDLTTMSDDLKRQVLAHNQAWDQACKK